MSTIIIVMIKYRQASKQRSGSDLIQMVMADNDGLAPLHTDATLLSFKFSGYAVAVGVMGGVEERG